MALESPVWFITAASSGFGSAIALEALQRGHHVIATARRSVSLAQLRDAGAATMDLDVTASEETIVATVDKAISIHGRITHLVNTAGYILEGCVEEASPAEGLSQFNTNVFGTIALTKALTPHLRAQGAGVIANFGSIGSWRGGPAIAIYCASKWAVSGLTEGLAEELRPFGIKVCVVEPGYFRTGFLNAGRRTSTEMRIDAYSSTAVGQMRDRLEMADNNQPGDVVKGARVVVDVLTQSGAAEGRDIPIRLVLGSDCVAAVRNKANSTLTLLDEWKPITTSTNY